MPALPDPRPSLEKLAGGLPPTFWALWTGMLVNRCGSFVLPFMALYLTRARHLSLAQAGLVVGLYGAGGAIAGPLGGFLADHVGRRFTLLLSLALGGAGMIALGFVERLEWIAPGIFLVALLSEMYRPAMQAAVADLVPAADRVRAFGLVYWVINLGFSIGLLLGGALADRSWTLLFVGDGATTLAFALVIALRVPETRPVAAPLAHGEPRRSALAGFLAPYRERTFVAFLGLSFLFAMVFMQNPTTFPLDMAAHGVGTSTFGAILAVNGVLVVLLQPWLGPVLSRRSRSRTLAVSTALAGVGFGLNALVHTAPLYALGVVIWTLGEIGVLPVASALVADLAPAELRGRYQGAYGLSFGLAVCVAPPLGTFVLQRFGSVALWGGCLVLGLLIGAGHLALARPVGRLRAVRLAAARALEAAAAH